MYERNKGVVIRVLTSAMGLGTYVPALFLKDFFQNKDMLCKVYLIESYLGSERIESFLRNKELYHKSFKAAKFGHKLAERQLGGLLGENEKKQIYEDWDRDRCELFIIMSGNWMDVLLEYMRGNRLSDNLICAVHMDVGSAPSWSRFANKEPKWNIAVYNERCVEYILEYPKKFFKNERTFTDPEESYIYIHGGGWGMGTYQERYADFKNAIPYKIRTTVHSLDEVDFYYNWEYFLLDKHWMPWETHTKELYPPIRRIEGGKLSDICNDLHNGMYSLYEDCCAIISKAGGGTLMDSLITATPLVFIDPIAKHERRNQELWVSLHFGVTYEEWKKSGFSLKLLYELYQSLIKYRESIPGLGSYLLGRISENGKQNI